MFEKKKRLGLIVYLYYNRDARKLNKYGNVVYHSRRMRYSVLYIAQDETDKIIERVVKLREEASAKIVSITNHPETTLSKLSNINLTYGFQTEHSAYDPLENLTSQLPVISFIEILAHQAIEKSDNRN